MIFLSRELYFDGLLQILQYPLLNHFCDKAALINYCCSYWERIIKFEVRTSKSDRHEVRASCRISAMYSAI